LKGGFHAPISPGFSAKISAKSTRDGKPCGVPNNSACTEKPGGAALKNPAVPAREIFQILLLCFVTYRQPWFSDNYME
jgi:hypothetical protein